MYSGKGLPLSLIDTEKCKSAFQGTRVNEETEFREAYSRTSTNVSALQSTSIDIMSYRGPSPYPKWLDVAPCMLFLKLDLTTA